MPIDPRISLGVQPLQIADPLAQYGQVQNILAAQDQRRAAGTQNELAQAQLGQIRTSLREAQEAQDFITKTMAEAKKNNAPTSDPMEAAKLMLDHPNPKVREVGQNLFDANQKLLAYQQDRDFANRTAPQPLTGTALPSAAGAQSVPVPNDESYNAWLKEGSDISYKDWLKTQTNPLAPAAAPAPVNALAPAAPAQGNALAVPSRASELLAEITDLRTRFPYSAKAKEQIAFLTERYKEAIKPQIVAPNSAIVVDGQPIFTAKEKPLTPTDLVRNYEYAKTPEGGSFKGTFAEFKAISTAKTTNVFGVQEKAFEGGLGKGQSERILANQIVAQDAAAILETNQVGRDLLNSGAIVGTGADFFVGFNNALKQAGIDFGYADAAANSQAYAAAMGANVGRIIKQFGAGTGLSDADRDYAAQMAGGKISITEAGLRKILDINDRAARNVIERHNKSVKGIKTNIPLEVEMPTFTQPKSAVDQIPGQNRPATAAPSNSVTLPDGRVKTFPNAEAANKFKKAAGL
jgi:hypothetical protein